MNIMQQISRQIDEAAIISPQILQRILETTREGILVVGQDMRIIASNAAAYNAFARGNGTLEGKRLSETIRDLTVHDAFRAALENQTVSDVRLEFAGIETRLFDVHIAPIEFNDEQNAVGFFYDITQIEHLETVRQEFLSNISHELRTPLTSILAFVETLQNGAIDDAENNRRFLDIIQKNASRMHYLINDILELSSIESGKTSIEPNNARLAAAVDEIFTNLSSKAKRREIKLVNRVPKDAVVYADAVRLEQMLTNLIDNAVKFNRPSGKVIVSHSRRQNSDLIAVSDMGEGISAEHLQRIFERFYRTDRARSREIGGTGLGLAIVKHLARLHGGEVAVSSNLGEGSTFMIELPHRPTNP